MVILRRKIALGLGVAFLVGAGFLAYRWQNRQSSDPFPRLTIDADGAIGKKRPELSPDSRARIPDSELRFFIFGRDASVIDGGVFQDPEATDRPKEYWITVRVSNPSPDIAEEYREYFSAAKWYFLPSVIKNGMYEYTVRTSSTQLRISIIPRQEGGSTVHIRKISLK